MKEFGDGVESREGGGHEQGACRRCQEEEDGSEFVGVRGHQNGRQDPNTHPAAVADAPEDELFECGRRHVKRVCRTPPFRLGFALSILVV